jgi:hypothetical protein
LRLWKGGASATGTRGRGGMPAKASPALAEGVFGLA